MRFPLFALLSVTLCGLVWLAPRLLRNQELAERVWQQQQELIALQQQNQQQRLLVERLHHQPQIAQQLQALPESARREQIALPESLTVELETRLIRPPSLPFSSPAHSNSAPAAAEPETLTAQLLQRVTAHDSLRRGLLWLAACLLMFGLLPWQKRIYRHWAIRCHLVLGRLLDRYRLHPSHATLPAPHFATNRAEIMEQPGGSVELKPPAAEQKDGV